MILSAATFCWRDSSLQRASLCCSPFGNTWSSNFDIREDGSRSRCLLSRLPSGNRNRGLWFRLLAAWCGSSFGRWRCFYPGCTGSGAEGAFSARRMPFTRCGCPCGCWRSAGISQSWLNYTRFAASEWRAFLRVAVNVAGIILAIFLLRAGDLLVAGPKWDPTQAKSLATLNQMAGGVLVLACIFAGLLCVHELRPFPSKNAAAT